MEERSVDEIIKATHWPRAMAATALGMLALFLLVATVSELKSYGYIGSGITATNTISVTGEGTVFAIPDVATFSVTVQETAKDVTTAQAAATTKSNDIVAYLKEQGVADADVQTTDYSVDPQYQYQNAVCPSVPVTNGTVSSASAMYCPPGKQVLTGYQVSQTLSVKVRDTTKAGSLLAGVGSRGASSVSGLTFTVADQNLIDAQARDKAITDAKSKADVLAKSLGVSLVRIVGFSEGGGSVYYPKAVGMTAESAAAPSPEIPVGQNTVTSDVTVTYEIR